MLHIRPTISYSSADKHQIEIILNEDLQKLSEWAKNGLLFSIPKTTEVMLISNVFNDNNFELIMDVDGTFLNIVETHRHLGVHLSSNNKWSKHIDSIMGPPRVFGDLGRMAIYFQGAGEHW